MSKFWTNNEWQNTCSKCGNELRIGNLKSTWVATVLCNCTVVTIDLVEMVIEKRPDE